MSLHTLTMKEALEGLKTKKFSVTELTQSCLDQIEKHNHNLNVFLTVDKKGALAIAKELDNAPQDFEKNPLLGIPLALKDIFSTKGIRTTAAARVLGNYIPQYDATVTKRLKDAGSIILGKLNLDAWAHGSSGENSDFGVTKNPWDVSKVAGGSSSGSAASIAADMCLASSGTDTCGSIRLPASFCGVVGLKPTYGRVSRYGIIAMASSLDTIGHFSKDVWDCAKYLEVSAGKDPLDATTPDVKVPKYTDLLSDQVKTLKGLRIGVPKEYFSDNLTDEVKIPIQKALAVFESQGAILKEISLPHTDYGLATYYIIQPSEVSSNLGRYDGVRYGLDRMHFGTEAKRRIMIGTYALSSGYYDAYYKKAMQVRTLICQDFVKAFTEVDVIVAPVGATPAFGIGEKQDPLQMYLTDIYAAPSSLAGIPSLALPCGMSSQNLPIGMQIMGNQFREDLILQVGHEYQLLTDWHKKKAII